MYNAVSHTWHHLILTETLEGGQVLPASICQMKFRKTSLLSLNSHNLFIIPMRTHELSVVIRLEMELLMSMLYLDGTTLLEI